MSKTSSDAHTADRDVPPKIAPLFELLGDGSSLAVVCHDDPDPDCLASALALERLAHGEGVAETQIVYGGKVSHRQNREMIDRLELDVRPYDPDLLDAYELVALVDQSRPGENNPLPRGTRPDVVIDHHPGGADGRYVDTRPFSGATATMLTEYFRRSGIPPGERVATGLLFGIRRETLEFIRRSTTLAEYEAAQYLHPLADLDLIQALSESLFTPRTLDAIGRVIDNRSRRGRALVSGAGHLADREAIPLAADYLLNLAGTGTTAVYGVVEETVQVSARTRDPDVHVGTGLARAFDDIGSAGGHRTMAGATLPLENLFGEVGNGRIDRAQNAVERLIFDHLPE